MKRRNNASDHEGERERRRDKEAGGKVVKEKG